MAIFLKTDGAVERYDMPKGKTSLDEIQKRVGGLIEVISIDDGLIMIADEEAKLKSKTINLLATTMWVRSHPGTLDYIAGDVIICNDEELQ